MKLQSQVSRKYGDTEYEKSWIVIPEKLLKELGWKTGQELKAEVKGDKLIIEKD
jgi:antitoxin component of MazEF toxin-antitoxin module